MLTITIANQKGGVGKTTVTVNLGRALVDQGYQVVVLDLDPQANATTALGLNPLDGPTLYDVWKGNSTLADVLRLSPHGMYVAPGHIDLALAEQDLLRVNRERVVKRALESLPDEGGIVLIDCPPTLGQLTINALTAASHVLIPLQCQWLALAGLNALLDTVSMVRRETNPALEILGVLLTMYDKTSSASTEIERSVREAMGEQVFSTPIAHYKSLYHVGVAGPIQSYSPAHPAAAAFAQLAEEVIARGA